MGSALTVTINRVQGIALALIVRDTEVKGKQVGRCIRSAAPFCDRAVVIDTGSVDDTMDTVRRTCQEVGLPLLLEEADWVGHSHNRTELLRLCRAQEDVRYVLMLDADMELVAEQPLPELTLDEYMIPVHDRSLIYPLPLLTLNRREFFYEGVTHTHLCVADGPINGGRLTGVWKLVDHGGGGDVAKIEEDVRLLSEAVGKNPADARSWFYLAQSFRDLDRVDEAVAAYKIRAMLGGWEEEVYHSLYMAGGLLCGYVNFFEGAKLLLAAAEMKPNRAEALRVLAAVTANVADKVPFPHDELLFVEPSAYKVQTPPPLAASPAGPPPPMPDIRPNVSRIRRKKITAADVSAIVVTRGNVDLAPVLDTLPYPDVVVWDNSQREHDYKVFGRYAAIPDVRNPVVFWVDDDVLFTAHDALLAAWEPGVVVANMDQVWVDGAGYGDDLVLLGAGSLCPADLPATVFGHYLQHYPWDDDLLVEADFAFGTLAPWKRVDLGYDVRPFSDDTDRLYQQPGQTERKWEMIERCKRIRDERAAA